RITPQRARNRNENRVAIPWINGYPCDAFGLFQAGTRPRFAAVGGFVDSVANGHAVACPRFTSAYPNVFRILRVERDGADRLHSLFVKYRAIPRSAIIGFPNAATGCTHKQCDLARWLVHSRDAGNASAHCRRADVACAEAGNARRTKWSVGCVDRNCAKKKRCENASHFNSITYEIHRGANSVLRKLSAVVEGHLFGRGNEISCHPRARWLRVYR